MTTSEIKDRMEYWLNESGSVAVCELYHIIETMLAREAEVLKEVGTEDGIFCYNCQCDVYFDDEYYCPQCGCYAFYHDSDRRIRAILDYTTAPEPGAGDE